jgi:ubiquinone/menaquinone biosynthesis C-methylase UbiE
VNVAPDNLLRPTPFSARLWNTYAAFYDLGVTRLAPYRQLQDDIVTAVRTAIVDLRGLAAGPPLRLLDLCCGTGNHLARLLRSIPDLEATGIDLSPAMLRVARRKCGRHARVRWLCGDADRALLSLPPDSFDLIVMCNAFYPQPRKESLLAGIRRVLRPSRAFILTDPGSRAGLFTLLREHARATGPTGLHVLPLLLASFACSLLVQGNAAKTFLTPAAAREMLTAAGLTVHTEARTYAGGNYLLTARREA